MIRTIVFICCSLMVVLPDKAQGQKRNVTQPVQQVTIDASRLDKQVSELMANHLSPTKVKVNDLAIARLEEYHKQVSMESLLYPADELYNSNWDTIHVNPFRKSTIEFPDMYTINCQTFSMPIDNEVKITSKYGVRRRQMHRGTDLKVSIGDTIRAVFDGKVRIKSFERRGYGYYLVLRHPNGLETVYGHLSKFLVNENQIVRSGDAIGLGGNTGRSTGSHLHFETRFLGKDINPEEIIDFYNGAPYKDEYVFHNIKVNGKKTNMYSTSANAIAVHRVKRGETLSHIATMYGTTIAELCSLNGISRNVTLSIGQAIQFRAKQVTVEASPTVVSQTAKEEPTQTIASTPSANNFPEVTVSDEPVYHRIQSGDTLSSLAIKYGTTVKKICELNGISENRILRVGQQLRCS